MGYADFGITLGHQHYIALRVRYNAGINWIRRNIGHSVDVENAIPVIIRGSTNPEYTDQPRLTIYNQTLIDALIQRQLAHIPLGSRRREHFANIAEIGLYPVTNEGEGIAYSAGIYSLVEPWGDMLSPPYRDLNRELSRFAGRYDTPGYNPLTEHEQLLLMIIKKVKEIIEAKEEKIKKEMKNKKEDENKPSLKDLEFGKNFNNSEAAREARNRRSEELRREKLNKVIEEALPAIAFGQILENADIGYLLLILTSNEIGLTHPDDSVREGTVNIISTLIKAILTNMEQEIQKNVLFLPQDVDIKNYTLNGEERIDEKPKPTSIIDEAILLLQCTSRALNISGCGLHDRNPKINRKAKDLEDFVFGAGAKLKALKDELHV